MLHLLYSSPQFYRVLIGGLVTIMNDFLMFLYLFSFLKKLLTFIPLELGKKVSLQLIKQMNKITPSKEENSLKLCGLYA